MLIVPRVVWGARKPKSVVPMKSPVSELWIHHTAGAAPPDLPQKKADIEKAGERASMRGIQAFHMDGRGWSDIAYNFVIFPSGRVYKGRGWSRQGAHTEGHNDHAVAFCFAGNFEEEIPTVKALDAARELKLKGKRRGRLVKTGLRIGGHREASGAATSCPGRNLFKHVPSI